LYDNTFLVASVHGLRVLVLFYASLSGICSASVAPDTSADSELPSAAGSISKAVHVDTEALDMPPECPPKDFSLSEQELSKYTSAVTKGTLQVISPCGAKVFMTEMVQSESISILIHSLSSFMPLIADDMVRNHEAKMQRIRRQAVNPKSGKMQSFPHLPLAQSIPGVPDPAEARFVIVYDYACGLVASLNARARRLQEQGITDFPNALNTWATCSKFVVDKFHMRGHIGVLLTV
jgi:hypothetical protein